MKVEASVDPQRGGPDWTPITPETGSLFHAETHSMVAPVVAAGLFELAGSILERALPDPVAREKARAKLARLQKEGALEESRVQLAAIFAEADSADRWTSRARPAFLYVMYVVILGCIAGGVAGIWWPAEVTQAAQNVGVLLAAIPESLWWLFGAGYLGYTGARSFDKWRGVGR